MTFGKLVFRRRRISPDSSSLGPAERTITPLLARSLRFLRTTVPTSLIPPRGRVDNEGVSKCATATDTTNVVKDLAANIEQGNVKVSTDQNTGTTPFQIEAIVGVSSSAQGPLSQFAGEAPPTSRGASGPSLSPPKSGAIEFRVLRNGSPTRRLRLSGARYTFGSGEGCSICLDDSSLRPLHAVLIRDTERVVLRAYSIPIEVNGDRTTEVSLQVGDVIRLGAYRLELLSLSASGDIPISDPLAARKPDKLAPDEPGSTSSAPSTTAPSFDELRSELGRLSFADATALGGADRSDKPGPVNPAASFTASPSSVRETSSFHSSPPERECPASVLDSPDAMDRSADAIDHQVWRDRLRREVKMWRQRQEECERLVRRCGDHETELRQRETELWNRAERLQSREALLKSQETAALEIQKEYIVQQQELEKLQDEYRQAAEHWERRGADFRKREVEYQRQVDEATRRLAQSKDQAENAARSVSRMREQLNDLNQQLEDLSDGQQHLQQQEQQRLQELEQQKREWESARHTLVAQRDQAQRDRHEALDAREKSESLRGEAEERLAHMRQSLEATASDNQQYEARLRAGESVADELRAQVAEVQQALQDAQSEAAKLNTECRRARERIETLETAQANRAQESDDEKQRWADETEQLRSSVAKLNDELEDANTQLGQLRQANDDLAERLDELGRQRDDAIAEAESRPTHESLEKVRGELTEATKRLDELEREHDAALRTMQEQLESVASVQPPVAEPAAVVEARLPEESSDDRFDPFSESPPADPSPTDILPADTLPMDPLPMDPLPADTIPADPLPAERPLAAFERTPELSEADGEAPVADPNEDVWPTYDSDQDFSTADEPVAFDPWATAAEPAPCIDANDEAREPVDVQETVDVQEPVDLSPWHVQEAPSDESLTGSWSVPVEPEEHVLHEPVIAESPAEEQRATEEALLDGEPLDGEPRDGEPQPAEHEAGQLARQLLQDIASEEPSAPSPDQTAVAFSETPPSDAWSNDLPADDSPANEIELRHEADEDTDDSDGYVNTIDFNALPSSLAGMMRTDEAVADDQDSPTFPLSELQRSETPPSPWENTGDDADRHDHVTPTSGATPDSPDDEDAAEDAFSAPQAFGINDSVLNETEYVQPDTERSDASPAIEAAPVIEAAPSPPDPAGSSGEADDDSIEAYMNRLLQRVQGSSTAPAAPASAPPAKTPAKSAKAVDANQALPGPDVATSPVDPNAPLVARSQAPEKNTDLSAMRALANDSARAAISRSTKLQTRDTQLRGMSKFMVAGVFLIIGLGVFLAAPIWWVGSFGLLAGLIAAGSYVREGFLLIADARRRMLLGHDQDDAPSAA